MALALILILVGLVLIVLNGRLARHWVRIRQNSGLARVSFPMSTRTNLIISRGVHVLLGAFFVLVGVAAIVSSGNQSTAS